MNYFVPIPPEVFAQMQSSYYKEWLDELAQMHPDAKNKRNAELEKKSYSEYNYSGKGFASKIKTAHFEKVLKLTKDRFKKCNVLDFGCADGAFLPSLSHYFNEVFAIDINPSLIQEATNLKEKMKLDNVKLQCSKDVSFDTIKKNMGDTKYDLVYILEVMEHVGDSGKTMYDDKKKLLLQISELVEKDATIVISVPKMVGPSYLVMRTGILALGLGREPMPFKDFLKSVFLYDNSAMEPKWWNGGHMGFNYLKFEKYFAPEFEIVKKSHLLFQAVYMIKRKW